MPGEVGNKYVDYIKQKIIINIYRWTGALNKTGLNLHTLKTASGSFTTIRSTSSTAPKWPTHNDPPSSLPPIPRDPSNSKRTSLAPIPPTIPIIAGSKISTYPICSPTPSLRDMLSTRNSTSKNPHSFPKKMATIHPPITDKMAITSVLTTVKICPEQPPNKASLIMLTKKNQGLSKKDLECSRKKPTKLSQKWTALLIKKLLTSLSMNWQLKIPSKLTYFYFLSKSKD